MLRNAGDYSVCGMVLEMKALTVRQPWASLIVRGGKDIENRNWATRYTGLVAIHSSAKMARADMEDAYDLMLTFVSGFSDNKFRADEFPTGSILGTVEIDSCVTRSESPWFMGEYGFVLHNPIAFPAPIKCKGALGFWTVPESLMASCREQYRIGKERGPRSAAGNEQYERGK